MNKQEYAAYLKSDHWKELRSRKWASSSGRCAICGSTERIQTHHLLYRDILNVETSDLRLLCDRCHEATHLLIKTGVIKIKPKSSHHSIFAITKSRVKKHLGFSTRNLFAARNGGQNHQ